MSLFDELRKKYSHDPNAKINDDTAVTAAAQIDAEAIELLDKRMKKRQTNLLTTLRRMHGEGNIQLPKSQRNKP